MDGGSNTQPSSIKRQTRNTLAFCLGKKGVRDKRCECGKSILNVHLVLDWGKARRVAQRRG